jgi:hypothetical protein
MGYLITITVLTFLLCLFYQFKRAKYPKPPKQKNSHFKEWKRDLNGHEVKKVNQLQAWATRQRNRIYDELHQCDHYYLNGATCWHCGQIKPYKQLLLGPGREAE